MASEPKGNSSARKVHRVSDYGARAAAALNDLLPGQHRDKRVARKFGVSLRTAKYLRAGQHWTTERLSQASALLGKAFDAAIYRPASDEQHNSEMDEIAGRLARLEARFDTMDSGSPTGLASGSGAEAGEQSGEEGACRRMGPGRRATDRTGEAAPDEGTQVACSLQRREVKR